MTEEKTDGGIYVDSDWKQEAAREKQRLAEQEKKEAESKPPTDPGGQPMGPPSFFDLVNLLAMQAAIGLGGYQGPNGETLPANPAAAKHHIDLLEVLVEKTKGNLTEEEKRALDGVTHELRMHFVSSVTHSEANAPHEKEKS